LVERESQIQLGPCAYNPQKLKDKIKGVQDTGSRLTIFEEFEETGNTINNPPVGQY